MLAVVGNKGDNAKTDAIIKTNEAANQFAWYQAKGIKGRIASAEHELLTLLGPSGRTADIATAAERLKAKTEGYEKEQEGIREKAEDARKDAEIGSKINDRCDQGSLALQIAIVIASVSILARSRAFWIASIILGLIGTGVGVMAFLI